MNGISADVLVLIVDGNTPLAEIHMRQTFCRYPISISCGVSSSATILLLAPVSS